MIVTPNIFNYRLIIGSLLVVLTCLGIYSFNNYKSIKSYEVFLKQEKSLIENELSEMLASYDELDEGYDFMSSELQEAKLETKKILDSLRALKIDLPIIAKYRNHLSILKLKSKMLLSTIDSLNAANLKLLREKKYAQNAIKKKTVAINELEEANDSLNKTIDIAAVLKVNNLKVKAYKLKSGKKRFTEKARRANAIDVCITLSENPLTEKGEKSIYIQVVSPEGNVVSDKGEVIFGNSSLIYSKKEIIDYDNNSIEICAAIMAEDEDKSFLKGYYFVNVFHENIKLSSTSIKLK